MKWPWQRPSRAVQEALDGSQQRLDEARQKHQQLEPHMARFRRAARGNHFAETVSQVFEVRTDGR